MPLNIPFLTVVGYADSNDGVGNILTYSLTGEGSMAPWAKGTGHVTGLLILDNVPGLFIWVFTLLCARR